MVVAVVDAGAAGSAHKLQTGFWIDSAAVIARPALRPDRHTAVSEGLRLARHLLLAALEDIVVQHN